MNGTEEKKTIVFVCTGNTCRSPMAETVFRFELNRRRIENAEVYSAGIAAKGDGRENINLKSVAVLTENGFSVANFHAQRLGEEVYRQAFAIICMTDAQRDFLMEDRWNVLRKAGEEEIENNVWSFSELCGYEIPDPYGRDLDAYRETYRLINAAMPPLFKKFFPDYTEAERKESEDTPPVPPKRKRGRPRKNPEEKGETKPKATKKATGTKTAAKPRKTKPKESKETEQ